MLKRLERELYVINKLGFADYFLIVWDFVRYAVENNIPCTARGSGVGSLVCYALRISHVCPLEYDLLFERFLDENRREAPDIDVDFCKDRRADVIQYVKDKYGEANVAQIGTFGTLAARAAIRDVGRTLGMPIFRVDQIVAMVPDTLNISLDEALEQSNDLKQAYESNGEVRELIDLARKIEGLARNVGTHAAAVVIAEKPVGEYVPLQHVKGKTEVITQWAMGDVERAGLLKMDFLGLRNLTILAKSIELMQQSRGERIDPHKFPLHDAETFALLCRGETKGIFQLESGGIRDLLQRMKPDHFRDIVATNALYRPGPLEGGMVDEYIEVKHGRRGASYPHEVDARGARRDPRRDGLPGAGDADHQPAGRHPARRCVHLHQGDLEEEAADHRQVPRAVHRGRPREGPREADRRRPVQHDREVRGLRLQQVALDRVRADRLSDGVPEGPLSGRVHGRAALGRHSGPQLQEQGFARRASWKTASGWASR